MLVDKDKVTMEEPHHAPRRGFVVGLVICMIFIGVLNIEEARIMMSSKVQEVLVSVNLVHNQRSEMTFKNQTMDSQGSQNQNINHPLLGSLKPWTVNGELPNLRPPLVLIGQGCSGTTFLNEFSHRLVTEHGMDISDPVGYIKGAIPCVLKSKKEVGKPEYMNPIWTPLYKKPNRTENMSSKEYEVLLNDASRELVAETYRRLVLDRSRESGIDYIMTPKVLTYQFTPGLAEGLMALHAKIVVVFRSNALAREVCNTRDCFNSPQAAGEPPDGEWRNGASRAVFNNGSISTLCFHRRDHADANVLARLNVTWFDLEMRTLMGELGCKNTASHEIRDDFSVSAVEKAMKYHHGDFPVIEEETLIAFESYDKGTAQFNASVGAWESLLHAWGISPKRGVVLAEMDKVGIGKRKASTVMKNIYNTEEVTQMVDRWRKESKTNSSVCDWSWMVN